MRALKINSQSGKLLMLFAVLALNLSWKPLFGPEATIVESTSLSSIRPSEECDWNREIRQNQRVDCFHAYRARSGKTEREVRFNVDVVGKIEQAQDLFGRAKGEEEVIEVTIGVEGCDERCQEVRTYKHSEFRDIGKLQSKITEELKDRAKRVAEQAEQERIAQEKEEKEAKKAEERERKIAECLIDPDVEDKEVRLRKDSVKWGECQSERMLAMDEEEAERHYKLRLQPHLRELLASNDPEHRAQAKALIETIGDSAATRDVKQSLFAMELADRYQQKIMSASRRMHSAPQGSMQYLMAQQELMQLQQTMQYDFGQRPAMLANYGGISEAGYEEFAYWQGRLNDGISMASQNPGRYLSQLNTAQSRVIPDILNDLDQRLARMGELSERDLITTQAGWNGIRPQVIPNSYLNRLNGRGASPTSTFNNGIPRAGQNVNL